MQMNQTAAALEETTAAATITAQSGRRSGRPASASIARDANGQPILGIKWN